MSAASCSKVMVSEWQDGRVGFLFLLQGKGEDSVFIYAFIGNGPEQIQKIANAAIQPINHVNVTFDGETSTHIAVGACEFDRSEEHTSELQSLMRISYAVFCLKKKKKKK